MAKNLDYAQNPLNERYDLITKTTERLTFLMSLEASKIGTIMTSHPAESPSITEVCAGVKRLGYCASQSIRIYGEEFEVMSDPFPESGGIAVSVRTKKSDVIRVLQLPATVLQSVKGPRPNAA